ncbi:MAG: hypothetical protein AAB011_09930 [Candidatus Eisenbacteria bacterium]
MALGFAAALAAASGAVVIQADAASARVNQELDDAPIPDDAADDVWVDEEDEAGESDAEADTSAPALLVKPGTVIPDSLLSGKGAFLPAGGALPETLGYKAPGVGIGAAAKPEVAKPKEKRTPFGIHPAAFFVVLLAGHVFLVRAVTD